MAQIYDTASALQGGYTNWGNTAGQNILANRLRAQERNDQNALGAALPQALNGDQNALAQIAKLNPNAALSLYQNQQENTRADAKTKREEALQMLKYGAGMLVSAPDDASRAQVWSQVGPQIKALGGIFANVPDQYDPSVLAGANSILERFPKEAEGFTLNENDRRYDASGRLIAEGAPKKESTPAEIQGYKLAQEQGFKGSYFDYQSALKKAGASSVTTYGAPQAFLGPDGKPVVVRPDSQGGMREMPGYAPIPPTTAPRDPTEDQNKSYGFYKNAQNSLNELNSALKDDPNAWVPSIAAETLDKYVPIIGESAANKSLTPAQQRYRQAIYTIADMSLRAETGANAPEPEVWRKVKQLTPRPEDSKGVREQKQRAIAVIVDTLKTRAGRALAPDEIPNAAASNPPKGRFTYIGTE